jgi:hypothetical protein
MVPENFGQGHGGLFKDASSEPEKVDVIGAGDDAIDSRIPIGSDREEGDLVCPHSIFVVQASDDSFVI